jgi:TolC family type I secretion outer membrane protein
MRAVKRLVSVAIVAVCVTGAAAAWAGASESAGPPEAAPPGLLQKVPATLSLEEAIDLALRYNPQVAAAEKGVYQARAQVVQAESYLYPRVSVNTQRVTPIHLPPFSFQSRDTTWDTTFVFSQPVYTGGSLREGVRAAKQYLEGSQGSYERMQQQVAYQVRQGYYGVLTAEQSVAVAREALDSAREHLRVARLRYEAGVAPQFDVLAAEARVASVEQGLISAQAQEKIARASLATILGVELSAETELTTPRPVHAEKADLASLEAEALAKRPDLLAARAQVSAARAQISIARAARQPTISASLSYTVQPKTVISGEAFGAPGTEIVIAQSSGYGVLAATWSLFNAGQVLGEIRAAQAAYQRSQDVLEGLKQSILLDVRSAYLLIGAAEAQIAAAQKEVEQAQEANRVASLRYQEGVGTSVEILDSEANLEAARTNLNNAIYGLNLAVAQLDLAIGRSLKRPTEEPGPQAEGAGD